MLFLFVASHDTNGSRKSESIIKTIGDKTRVASTVEARACLRSSVEFSLLHASFSRSTSCSGDSFDPWAASECPSPGRTNSIAVFR